MQSTIIPETIPMDKRHLVTSREVSGWKIAQLITLVEEKGYSDSLKTNVKELLLHRMGNLKLATTGLLQEELNSKRPQWYYQLVEQELARRAKFEQHGTAPKVPHKAQTPRRKAYQTLLQAHEFDSVFKTKWQFKTRIKENPKAPFWSSKVYSRDYPDERRYFEEEQKHLVMQLIKNKKRDFVYELFGKSGIKPNGFNGFNYSLKTFNKMFDSGDIQFFGIYLNRVTEQQSNLEDYSMEIWSWGEWGK